MSDITTREINDNKLVISKSGNKEDSKEYFGINVTQVIIGVENPNKQEIITTSDGNIRRNVVEAQEVYNIHKQKHHNWFLLDLETGKRGYYPGCIIAGKTCKAVNLHINPNSASDIIEVLPENMLIEILNLSDLQDSEAKRTGWYKIKCTPNIGYIEYSALIELQYHDPF